ncbi:MAG: GNAT family N-acetyltransferase [Pirellulales bacterium]|nr:GNAT family N-acetyltransferase [Pirellulales bacterium]
MLRFHTFRNTDPPAITSIWRSRNGQPGFQQPVSVDLFEQLVFGKLYFDYPGLVLALDDEQPVGFAHAGFGPNEARSGISTEHGVVCVLFTRPEHSRPEVTAGLLEQCEAYLRGRGAKVIFGGGLSPVSPFYLGLYGGSEVPGVLDTDVVAQQLYAAQGYQPDARTVLMRRDLTGFRPAVDRQQREFRRQLIVEVRMDPPARNFWEASRWGDFDLTRFELVPRGGGAALATATVRSMEPTGAYGMLRAAGLVELLVSPSQRRHGLATFLLGEAFRSLAAQGVSIMETMTTESNPAALGLLRKFGFEVVGAGTVYRKNANGP